MGIMVQAIFKIKHNNIIGLTTPNKNIIKPCKWCGTPFKIKSNHQLYCSTPCREYGYKEATRQRVQRYRKRWRNIPSEMKKPVMGTRCIGAHMADNFKTEQEVNEKELRLIGLK